MARDRVISTVDVAARHGHKSRARTFDGYKTHLNVDPDDELIKRDRHRANTPDREVIDELLDDRRADQPEAAARAQAWPDTDEPDTDDRA